MPKYQGRTNELIARIPLIGSTTPRNINADQASGKDQRFVNCIPEIVTNPLNGQKTGFINKRPGLAVAQSTSAGDRCTALNSIAAAIGNEAGNIIVAALGPTSGTSRSYWFGNTSASETSFHSSSNPVYAFSETSLAGVPVVVLVERTEDGVEGYNFVRMLYWDFGGGGPVVVSNATDTDFPPSGGGAGNFAHAQGWAFFQTPDSGLINSDLNSLSSYSALGVIQTNQSSDRGIGVMRLGDKIVSFGTKSVEFFDVVGHPPPASPLKLIPSMGLNVGALSSNALISVEDNLIWISSSLAGMFDLMMYSRAGLRRVSNPEISKLISTALTINTTGVGFEAGKTSSTRVFLAGVRMFGQLIILISVALDINSVPRTMAYSVDNDFWFEWTGPTSTLLPTHAVGADNILYFGSNFSTAGKIYKVDPRSPVYTDDGSAYSMIIQTGPMDFDTGNRKFVTSYELIADTQASGTTTLEVSDDDGTTWATLGTFDMTLPIKKIYQGGSFKPGRSHRLTHSANTAFRAQYLDIYGWVAQG